MIKSQPIIVYFGVFGDREYVSYQVVDAHLGAAKVACRWCVSAGEPEEFKCRACKGSRWMWIGI